MISAVLGLNHAKASDDAEGSSSPWRLAVDPQCTRPGLSETLVGGRRPCLGSFPAKNSSRSHTTVLGLVFQAQEQESGD